MNYLALLIFIIIGVLLGRIAFIFVIKRDSTSLSSIKKIFSLHTLHLINAKVNKKIYLKYVLSLLLAIVSSIISYFGLLNIINQNLANLTTILYVFFLALSFVTLLYLAVYDLVFYEIPVKGLQFFLALSILFNILASLISILYGTRTFFLGNISNIFSAILLGLIFFIVVKLTKERGMGMGDVYLMLAVGLSLGLGRSITAYILTLVIASLVGILLSIFKKRFTHLIIPLVPFIFLGFILSIAINESIIRLFLPF